MQEILVIFITSDPVPGARSISASAHRHTYIKELAKDSLICALDALAQSSDAFPPLKSIAGGLMFCVNWADVSIICRALHSSFALTNHVKLVSSNKEGIRDACDRINNLAKYFKLALQGSAPLVPAHYNTVDALAEYHTFNVSPLVYALLKPASSGTSQN